VRGTAPHRIGHTRLIIRRIREIPCNIPLDHYYPMKVQPFKDKFYLALVLVLRQAFRKVRTSFQKSMS
jgi:hypothetical protein